MAKKGMKTHGSEGQMPSSFDRAVQWIHVHVHDGPKPKRPEDIWSPVYEDIQSDSVAFKIFDLAADSCIGPERAYVMLQATLRKDFGFYPLDREIVIDGDFGYKTSAAVNWAVAEHGEEAVLDKLIARAERYHRSLYDAVVPLKTRLRNVRDIYEIVPEQKEEEAQAHETEQAGESAE